MDALVRAIVVMDDYLYVTIIKFVRIVDANTARILCIESIHNQIP